MGLDLGEKTIGVSISDELGWTAQGVEVIRRTSGSLAEDLARLEHLIKQYNISCIVVGFPKNMDGSIGPRAQQAQAFAKLLEEVTGLEVKLWDERLTTVAAERVLISADVRRSKRKQVVDKMASMLILQSYLDAQN
jgi:putative Holliday junction resolvase